jgi:uncharacterized Tic20 family protein
MSQAMTSDERTYATFIHLGGLAALTQIPFAGLLAPLVLWLVKKDESRAIDAHGREALNFQITLLLFGIGLAVGGFFLTLLTLGLALPLVLLAYFALLVIDVVFCVLAALEANKGRMYRYPFAFRLIGPAPMDAGSVVCQRCGYDLSSAPGRACPECGEPRA